MAPGAKNRAEIDFATVAQLSNLGIVASPHSVVEVANEYYLWLSM